MPVPICAIRQARRCAAVQATLATQSADRRREDQGRHTDRTDLLARSFTWQAPGMATLRGLGLAAVQALPPLKAALARQMMFGRR